LISNNEKNEFSTDIVRFSEHTCSDDTVGVAEDVATGYSYYPYEANVICGDTIASHDDYQSVPEERIGDNTNTQWPSEAWENEEQQQETQDIAIHAAEWREGRNNLPSQKRRTYECKDCGKMLDHYKMERHMRTHTGEEMGR